MTSMCVWIDHWKVLIISGTYFGEPQPASNDQLRAAGDDVNGADADDSDKPEAEDARPEEDTSANQGGKVEATSQQQIEDEVDKENTDNGVNSASEDGRFSKKHGKSSSKYFLTPQPPTSQLVLVIYGDLGKTSVLPLTAEHPQDVSFEPGQADEFKVSQHISHGPVNLCDAFY